MPFPANGALNVPHTTANPTSLCEGSPIKYGPVDLPQPSHSKNQRRSINLDSIEIVSTGNVQPSSVRLVLFPDGVAVDSLRSTVRLTGRAPPLSVS